MKTKQTEGMQNTYLDSMHRTGRIGVIIAVVFFIGIPTFLGIYFDAMPSLVQIFSGSIGLLAIFVPICISEMFAYTPILGSSIYLSTITGNVLNLKLPAAQNAMKIENVEPGTEEADIVSIIAVCSASFVTIIVMILGVILMIPLQPFFALPAVQTATANILPALFGSLALSLFSSDLGGGVKTKGRLKGAIVPTILVVMLTLVDNIVVKNFDFMSQLQGFVIVAMIPVTYFWTRSLYRKGQIKVFQEADYHKA
jgi:hypothetical protein